MTIVKSYLIVEFLKVYLAKYVSDMLSFVCFKESSITGKFNKFINRSVRGQH